MRLLWNQKRTTSQATRCRQASPGHRGRGQLAGLILLLPVQLAWHVNAADLDLALRGSWPSGSVLRANSIAVQNDDAYVGTDIGMAIIDVRSPSNTVWVGWAYTGDNVADVVVSGGYAYLAAETAGFVVIDVTSPTQPRHTGHFDTGGYASGVAVSGQYAYVTDEDTGLHVLDISDPAKPWRVGGVDGFDEARGVALSGHYALVADADDDQGLVVIDIGDPMNPQMVTRSGPSEFHAVTVSGSYAYLSRNGGLWVLDISDPAHPGRGGFWASATAPLSVAVVGNHAYMANYGAGLQILDVSNPFNPQLVGACTMDTYPRDVTVAGQYAYLAAGEGGLKVLDISDPATARVIGGADISHRLSTYAVAVADQRAYLACGADGVKVLSVEQPTARPPYWLGECDTPGTAYGVTVSGDYAYVADEDGLRVFDVSDPARLQIVGSYPISSGADRVAVSGRYAYVADYGEQLHVVDVGDPSNPQGVGRYTIYGDIYGLAVQDEYVYLTDLTGLHVLDVSRPAYARRIGGNTAWHPGELVISGDKLFLAGGPDGLVILNTYTALTHWILSLESPTRPESGQFSFSVQGLPGLPVGVERGTDLAHWESVTNLVLGKVPLDLLDAEVSPRAQQFYRAVVR